MAKDYDFDTEFDKCRAVGEELGIEVSVWSMYPTDFSEVPLPDLTHIRYVDTGAYWGGYDNTVEVSAPKTWREIWVACEHLIKLSMDHHHIFIEALTVTKEPGVYELHTGS